MLLPSLLPKISKLLSKILRGRSHFSLKFWARMNPVNALLADTSKYVSEEGGGGGGGGGENGPAYSFPPNNKNSSVCKNQSF